MLLYNLWPVEGLKVGQKWQKFIFFDTLSLTPYLDHLLKSDLHQNWQRVSHNTPLQLSGVYFMVLYNLYPVQGPKVGQKWQKFIFWHPIWTTCWSLIFTKIDIKYLKIPLYNRVVCILCYCTTCGLYKGQKLTKMGENTSIWWSGPLGFGDKVISYNSCIVQCCPLILGEGGGGQWAKSHFGEGGRGEQAKPHFGGVGVVVSASKTSFWQGGWWWWWSVSKTSSQLNRILLGDGGYK